MLGRRSAVLAGVAAVALSSGLVAAGSSGAAGAANAAKPKLYGWAQLSTGKVDTIGSIGLARFGSQLEAVWDEKVGSDATLATAEVTAAGREVFAAKRVLTPVWATINKDPQIFALGNERVIGFGGQYDANSGDPYSQGYEYVVTSADAGQHWSLQNASLTKSDLAQGSYGTDIVNDRGTPVIAYTAGSASQPSWRAGDVIDPIPGVSSPDNTLADTGPDAYNVGLGVDAKTGQTWAIWYSNSDQASTEGMTAQAFNPGVSTPVHAPNTAVQAFGLFESIQLNHRIVTADRVGGGVYAAYVEGYPKTTKIALWHLGASHALTFAPHGQVAALGTAAGPGGRLWVYWANQGSDQVHVVRTNTAANRVGASCSATTPGATSSVWDLDGNAAAGPLSLFMDAGAPAAIYSHVIKPCLGVSVTPHRISHKHGGKITVTVKDAGAGVKGATVRYAGTTKHTNAKGVVKFAVATHTSKGKRTVLVTDRAYQADRATFTVT